MTLCEVTFLPADGVLHVSTLAGLNLGLIDGSRGLPRNSGFVCLFLQGDQLPAGSWVPGAETGPGTGQAQEGHEAVRWLANLILVLELVSFWGTGV